MDIKNEVERQYNILKRGCEEVINEVEFKQKLEKSIKNNKPLKIKLGIDPTGSDLHIGHAVPLRKLKQFQDLLVIILIIAAIISGLSGQLESTLVIVVVIVINAILGTVQTLKAEKSFISARKQVVFTAFVISVPAASRIAERFFITCSV